jgi:hypothetical protein
VISTKANLKTVLNMEMVYNFIQTEIFMKGTGLMDYRKDMDSLKARTGKYIRVILSRDIRMVLAN